MFTALESLAKEIRKLNEDLVLLDCLEENGVDNWVGYGDSVKLAKEWLEN